MMFPIGLVACDVLLSLAELFVKHNFQTWTPWTAQSWELHDLLRRNGVKERHLDVTPRTERGLMRAGRRFFKSASLRFLPALPRMPDVCYFTPMFGSVFKTAPM